MLMTIEEKISIELLKIVNSKTQKEFTDNYLMALKTFAILNQQVTLNPKENGSIPITIILKNMIDSLDKVFLINKNSTVKADRLRVYRELIKDISDFLTYI